MTRTLESTKLQQLTREIGQSSRSGSGEQDIILDANSSPTRTIHTWLDGDHRIERKYRFCRRCEAGPFMNFETDPVPERVTEALGETCRFQMIARYCIGLAPAHASAYLDARLLLRLPDGLV